MGHAVQSGAEESGDADGAHLNSFIDFAILGADLVHQACGGDA